MTSANSLEGRAAVLAQYDKFAVAARTAAASEKLDNVRQKHLTSAVSWEQLAANSRKMEILRARRMEEELSGVASEQTPGARPLRAAEASDLRGSPGMPAGRPRTLIG